MLDVRFTPESGHQRARMDRDHSPLDEIIWRLAADLIRFHRWPFVDRFGKLKEINNKSPNGIFLFEKIHCVSRRPTLSALGH